MHYKIYFRTPATQYIHVEAKIESPNNETILQFPMWRPGRYELGNFPKNIHSFEVLNENGKKIPFVKKTKSTWQADTTNTREIIVRYRYFANELNAGSSFLDDLQLYVNPVNLLVYTEENINKECTLTLDIPSDFKLGI